MTLFALLIVLGVQASTPVLATVARCEVTGDADDRVYELQRAGDGADAQWRLAMRSRKTGTSPVLLPLPGAQPRLTSDELALDYRTQNGGREVRWTVAPSGARLDVHANFELEVNVEADLDPRVELMSTSGPVTTLACALDPKP